MSVEQKLALQIIISLWLHITFSLLWKNSEVGYHIPHEWNAENLNK